VSGRTALLDEARVDDQVEVGLRPDDADLEQQVRRFLAELLYFAGEEFLVRRLSCQRRYAADFANCSPVCFTSAPMIS